MHKTLLVHAVEPIAIVVVVVVIISTLASKVSTVVVLRGGTLLELDTVAADPCVGSVIVLEGTSFGEEATAEVGGGRDVVRRDLNRFACRGRSNGGDEGERAEEHGWLFGVV